MKHTLLATAVVAILSSRASAYVEIPYTLGRVVNESTNIVVMQVEKVNKERRLIYYKKVADLKGKHPVENINHQLANGFHPREPQYILDWAQPGKTAIFFYQGGASETCIGDYWYQSYAGNAPWWSMSHAEPFFCWCFSGNPEKLRALIVDMLAGKEVITPCAQFDPAKVQQYKNLLHEKKAPLWRMKASLKITDYDAVIRAKNQYVVGLGALGPEAVPAFVAQLNSPDAKVRFKAVEELGQIGSDAKAALDPLKGALKDADASIRLKTAESLLRIDDKNADALPVLIGGVGDAATRGQAIDILAGLAAAAKPALPVLVKTLADADPSVRLKAADAILKIDAENRAPIDTLIALLKDAGKANRAGAAELIGKIGAPAKASVGPLIATLNDTDPDVRLKIVEALGKMGTEAVPGLVQALKAGGSREIRVAALDALLAVGGAGRSAVPALVASLKDTDPEIRFKSADVLKPFASAAGAEAVPPLVDMLKTGQRDACIKAAEVIIEIGAPAKPAVPHLSDLVSKHTSGTVRRTCAAALAAIGPEARAALPVLRDGLTSEMSRTRPEIRAAIANALARLTPPQTGPVAELFQDDALLFTALLTEVQGPLAIETADKYSGSASVRVGPAQCFSPAIPGWNFQIAEKPVAGQYRYIRFAWKKQGGNTICVQISDRGNWERRYIAGANPHGWAAVKVAEKVPGEWVVVTRDLFKDFGPIVVTGIALTPLDGQSGLFDHIHLGRSIEDLDKVTKK